MSNLSRPAFISAVFTGCALRANYAHEIILIDDPAFSRSSSVLMRLEIPLELWENPLPVPETGAFQRLRWKDASPRFTFANPRPADYAPLIFSPSSLRSLAVEMLYPDPLPHLRLCPASRATHFLLRANWRFIETETSLYADHVDSAELWAQRISSLPFSPYPSRSPAEDLPHPPKLPHSSSVLPADSPSTLSFFYWHCAHLHEPYGADYWLVPTIVP